MSASAARRVRTSLDASPVNVAWDGYLGRAQRGEYHLQSSTWALAKAEVGWRSARVIATRDGAICGGCQLLLRGHASLGRVAHAPHAPVLADEDPGLFEAVLDGVDVLARAHRVVLLKLQPPTDRADVRGALLRRGFAPGGVDATSGATVRVDLRRPPDELLAAMRPSTRNHIRKAQRRGVVVRTGDTADLPLFGELLAGTARRQGFMPLPLRFYRRLWELYAPANNALLLVAEHEQTPLSMLFLLRHGTTLLYKMGAWSGERPDLYPNELAHWEAMLWAGRRGLRFYDLEGVSASAAELLAAGATRSDALGGLARFKLGFGGDVVMAEPPLDYTYRPVRASAARLLASRLGRWQWVTGRALGRERVG